jgi:hypothetical protein
MSLWNRFTGAAGAVARSPMNLGTGIGNLIYGTPVGTGVERFGGFLGAAGGAVARVPDRVGTGIGNLVNAPGQRNPLGFLERPISSGVGKAVLSDGANLVQDFLPFRPAAQAFTNLQQGNAAGFWGNLGMAGLAVTPFGGVSKLAKAGVATRPLAYRSLARDARLPVGVIGGLGLMDAALGRNQRPGGGLQAMMAARPQAGRDQGAGLRALLETGSPAAGFGAGGVFGATPPVDTSAVTGVGAPDGNMLDEYQLYLRQAQEDYERRLANISEGRAADEEMYRLGSRRARRGAAGRAANLSALLAATGLSSSPAAAEGGLGYEAQRESRELANLERSRMQSRAGATRGEAEADAERKRRIAELNRFLMTGPAAAAGNAPVSRR